MAVVQISKIQLRRGKKNQGTGMPQLASGEMAWAIDTQEVFIGNGAVGEGAPYVGNTKILTEHDSLLELANVYQYKKESVIPVAGTVTRSLQARLDDGVVNVKNWGIITYPYPVTSEETVATQTAKIQQAINEISSKVRVTLEFDSGEYRFLETLTLPSHVKIAGSGKNVTVFKFTGTSNAFATAENASNIVLDEFTIKLENTNSTAILSNNAERLKFSNIRLEYGTAYWAFSVDNLVGLKIIGSGADIRNNRFKGLEFSGLSYAVYTEGNVSYNNFDDCLLEYLHQGFSFGNISSGGANYNVVTNSVFDRVRQHGIIVHNGRGNISRGNIFKTVGGYTFNIIRFVTEGNTTEQDIFERPDYLEHDEMYNDKPYVQEVGGVVYRQKMIPVKISLQSTFGDTGVALRLPVGTATGYEINYVYKSINFNQTRKGTLHVTFDSVTNQKELVDEYEYAGLSAVAETAIKFSVEFAVVDGVKHIKIEYVNNNGTDGDVDVNTFIYTYSMLS